MQNKGILKVLVVALVIACVYALSFSFVARSVEKKADNYAATFDTGRQAEMRQNFLDSMSTQTVYNLGLVKFTYKDVKEKEINLGLDLKGGMNVLLEISPEDIIRALGNNVEDPAFQQALKEAKTQTQATGSTDYVDAFAAAYERVSGGNPLINMFNTPEMLQTKELSMSATNAQVVEYLKKQVNSAIDNSFMILSKRIDKFGIAQPNIQRVKNTGRILIELPGIKEPERVRKLLQGTASLEFWMTYDNQRIAPVFDQINTTLRAMQQAQTVAETVEAEAEETVAEGEVEMTEETTVEPTTESGVLDQIGSEGAEENVDEAAWKKNNPFFAVLAPNVNYQTGQPHGATPVVGTAFSYDTMSVNRYLAMPEVKALLPKDLKLLWGVKGIRDEKGHESNVFQLYAIRDKSGKGIAELDGGAVENASWGYSQYGSEIEVSMSMNKEGSMQWEQITRNAINETNLAAGFTRCVAVVLDDYVYSAPGVNEVIAGGSSRISGDFTEQEGADLATVLKSGKLPAPARIVQDTVVGPSLGAESIKSSMISFVIAFMLVLIYMIFFYNTAGWVASFALICNLFFLFGVLVAFGAVLTLPGIAGIVLTMGMAVDANVLIYERIKEELRGGAALSAAVAKGYKNAMSAIIDANVTTVITAIILMWFGTGPVQGFATTLLIGIITSFFTSIFITRLLFDARLRKGKNIKFSNKLTENFMGNTKYDFLGKRKVFYVVSLLLIVLSTVSLFTRGLNYGVDFTGGRSYVVRFDQPVTAEDVRASIDATFGAATSDDAGVSSEVKQYGNENQMRIVTQYRAGDESTDATKEIESLLYQALAPLYASPITQSEFETTATNPNGIISSDTVEASVARGIVINSFWAVALGLLGIGLYIIIRFRKWQWGAGSVIALGHDAFLTIGMFSLLYSVMPFNLEIDQAFIAAILTIIGYSINDKVVIFDRIREYTTLYPKRSTRENINNAINSTLARTINTSATTFVVLLAIFLFGGEVIRGFVFALMFGIVIGTFSSIFTATPIAYDLMNRADRDKSKN